MFMPFVRVALSSVLLIYLTSVQTRAADKTNTQTVPSLENYLRAVGYISVPLRRGPNNELRVAIQIAGKKREFMVDTGWSLTTIDTSLKSTFKTPRELGSSVKDSVLGILDNSEEVIIDELKFGTARLLNEPALVKALNSSGGSAIADGVIGCDFLLRHFCLIDCLDLKLYLRSERLSHDRQAELEKILGRSGLHGAPLKRTSALVGTCKAAIDGYPLVLMVDTGSSHTMIHSKTAERYQLRIYPTSKKMIGVGTRGNVQAYVTRPKLFEVDGVEMPLLSLPVGITFMSSWKIGEQGDSLENVDGFLGAELLATDHGIIALADGMLWFKPGKSSREEPK